MHARRLLQLLAGVAVLVLSPAAAIAAEGTSGAAGAGETSGSATAPPSTESTASTPPPAVQATPEETLNAPVVREHRARRPSAPGPASSPRRQKAPHKPAKPRQRTHKKAGASKSARRSGTPAPSPSAITPPLPLAFSGSLTGVPAFFIESFRIPPFLLPIYQAAGTAYGIPWQVLAAINEVETDYGRDLSVSTAGAEGWMQFLPSSWVTYGVDANGDGFRDPYNPADAIFAAARYLRAAGATTDLRGAIFAYNHSQAYVQSVLLRARLLGGTPSELLGAITGLTEARFPVHAPSHFTDGFAAAGPGSAPGSTIPSTVIYSQPDAPVIAVQDGQVVRIGASQQLGRFVSLRDAYGNTYTYARLGRIARFYPVLRPHERVQRKHGTAAEPHEGRPTVPASAGTHPAATTAASEGALASGLALGEAPGAPPASTGAGGLTTAPSEGSSAPAQEAATQSTGAPPILPPPAQPAASSAPASTPRVFRAGPNDVYLHALRPGARVIAGTVLGHLSAASASDTAPDGESAHMLFQIRPAGPGAPLIDPKPILDGWVALENSSIFRARGQSPFLSGGPSPGQVLLESKSQLEQQVLANPAISIYACGRQDIETDQIDRRVLATLEFLAVSDLRPTVSALKCGHSDLTREGNVSEHLTGDAVDISAINGIPITGHQGPGSIADQTIRKLLTLQGSMKPHQIISLMRYPQTDNTLALPDHFDHIHVGFRPAGVAGAHLAGVLSGSITPTEWIRLIARLGEIPNPAVRSGPSPASIPDHPPTTEGAHGNH